MHKKSFFCETQQPDCCSCNPPYNGSGFCVGAMEEVTLVTHTGRCSLVLETAQGSVRNSFGATSQIVSPTLTIPSLANITLVLYFFLCSVFFGVSYERSTSFLETSSSTCPFAHCSISLCWLCPVPSIFIALQTCKPVLTPPARVSRTDLHGLH